MMEKMMPKDEIETIPLTQLAVDKKPAEFKQVVVSKLNDMLKNAIDVHKVEVAGNLVSNTS